MLQCYHVLLMRNSFANQITGASKVIKFLKKKFIIQLTKLRVQLKSRKL